MRRAAALLSLALVACADPNSAPIEAVPDRVLVFSSTAGFRHASIPAGIAAVESLGVAHHFAVEATEDAAVFTASELSRFAAVIFLNTTGDVLNASQQAALEAFIASGRGFVGVHSATDTEYDWAWYGGLVGAYFKSHPAIQGAALTVVDGTHPSTSALPTTFSRTDEWYDFLAAPAESVNILITVDESSYTGGTMGAPHPISWNQSFGGGRSWYTAMGHTNESYAEAVFLDHLAGGIIWAAGF